MPFFTSPDEAFDALMGAGPPVLIDVRKPEAIEQSGFLFPQTSRRADQTEARALAKTLDSSRPVLVACAHAHNRSQLLASGLRGAGFAVSIIAGGEDGWRAAGLPMVRLRPADPDIDFEPGTAPTRWVTRVRPKIDRVACPWLIRRFLDPNAELLFAEPEWVLTIAGQTGAIAYDIPGAPLEHDGPLATFDTMLRAFNLDGDLGLAELALIVRGADTDRLDLHPASAGLLAASLGLSHRHGDDDHAMLREAFVLYDGLFAWARHARGEAHHWPRPAAHGVQSAA